MVPGLGGPIKEDLEPSLPSAMFTNLLEETVVVRPVGLQVQAEVEQRLVKHAMNTEEEGDEQASDPAVAVEMKLK